jgi:Rrf2 family transcriptional regulator, cysteine metabolism repressor
VWPSISHQASFSQAWRSGSGSEFPTLMPLIRWQNGQVPRPTMPFSAKTEYGLVALLDLASVYPTGQRVQTREICERHGMPERYLEQMLTALRKGGMLASVRGPRGGYQLTRPPQQITVAEVEACLECDPRSGRQVERNTPEFRAVAQLAMKAERARQAVLSHTTLEQLVKDRDCLLHPGPMFYI